MSTSLQIETSTIDELKTEQPKTEKKHQKSVIKIAFANLKGKS